MLTKALSYGLVVATIAAASLIPSTTPASAASVRFSFGPTTSHPGFHNGRQAVQVCRTKYQWVVKYNKARKVAVGTDCRWTYASRQQRYPDQRYQQPRNNGIEFRLF